MTKYGHLSRLMNMVVAEVASQTSHVADVAHRGRRTSRTLHVADIRQRWGGVPAFLVYW
jgi:hypothetical protein